MLSLPPDAQRVPQLYAIVLVFLGLTLLAIVVGWILLALNGKTFPDGLSTLAGAISGGLVGVIAGGSSSSR